MIAGVEDRFDVARVLVSAASRLVGRLIVGAGTETGGSRLPRRGTAC